MERRQNRVLAILIKPLLFHGQQQRQQIKVTTYLRVCALVDLMADTTKSTAPEYIQIPLMPYTMRLHSQDIPRPLSAVNSNPTGMGHECTHTQPLQMAKWSSRDFGCSKWTTIWAILFRSHAHTHTNFFIHTLVRRGNLLLPTMSTVSLLSFSLHTLYLFAYAYIIQHSFFNDDLFIRIYGIILSSLIPSTPIFDRIALVVWCGFICALSSRCCRHSWYFCSNYPRRWMCIAHNSHSTHMRQARPKPPDFLPPRCIRSLALFAFVILGIASGGQFNVCGCCGGNMLC